MFVPTQLFIASFCLLLLLGHPCSGDKDLKSTTEDMALNEIDVSEDPTAQQTRVHVDVRHPSGRRVASGSHNHQHRLSSSGQTDDSHPSSTRISHLHPSSTTRGHLSERQIPVRAHHSGTYGQYARRPTISYPRRSHRLSGLYGASTYSTVPRPQNPYSGYGYPRSLYPTTSFRKPFRPDSPFVARPHPYRPLPDPAATPTPFSSIHSITPVASVPIPATPISNLPHPYLPLMGVSRPFSPQLPEDALINQVDVRLSPTDPFIDSVNQAVSRDLFHDPSNFVYPESPFVNPNELPGPRDTHFNVNHDLSPAGSTYVIQNVPFVTQHDPSFASFDGSFDNGQPFSSLDLSFLNHGASPFVKNEYGFANPNTPVVDRDGTVINQGSASSYINRYIPYTPVLNQGSSFTDQPSFNQVSSSTVKPFTSIAFNSLTDQGVRAFNTRYPFETQNNIVSQSINPFDDQALYDDDFINPNVQILGGSLAIPITTQSLANPTSPFENQVHPYPLVSPHTTSSHFNRGRSYGKYYTKKYNHFVK